MATLPKPSIESQAHSQLLAQSIQQTISASNGWVSFADFMHMALYTPALGYYSGGAQKFGKAGDFVTAPEISPLFAQALARQVLQVLDETQGDILELGAGTGQLAADLLLALQDLSLFEGQNLTQYYILEVSDYLRQVQQENLQKKLPAHLFKRLVWLNSLPQDFVGLILGNEVLDAVPVHIIHHADDGFYARGVTFTHTFEWQDKPLTDAHLLAQVKSFLMPKNYLTEICPAANGLINSLAACLKHGVILMIDYGFGAAEYYHPQRNAGTLMCHYQHYAHDNPLINVGLQDITAHVNFTAIAETALVQNLSLAGYCNQANFLMNCGLLDILAQTSPADIAAYLPLSSAAQKLVSPAEMGELFKVIALSKNIDTTLIGFKSGDKAHTL
jgi:SAM-dependent MidA family methyltransferase